MPLRKEDYADMEKFTKTRKKQRNSYYKKTAIYAPNFWTSKQDEKVLKHDIPDSELSAIIHHSVKAIQIRRSKLKKALKNKQ